MLPNEWCGDNVLQIGQGEGCDNGVGNTNTPCVPPYGSDCTYCDMSCQSQTVAMTQWCGDGTVNGPEQCDNFELNGEDCESLGFTGGGDLSCDASCNFDTSDCSGVSYCQFDFSSYDNCQFQ